MPVAVLTGATSGIGRFIALGLCQAGYHVVLICRDQARGARLTGWISAQVPGARTEIRLADLRLLKATRHVGQEIAAAHPRIVVLVNNAGMFTAHRAITAEGREAVLAVNHLAPFVLADVLEPSLRAGAPSRIVNVGSSSSDRAKIDPDHLELTRNWGMVRAYAQSKLALMMASFFRADQLRGSGVVVNVVHPGTVATTLIRESGAIGLAWRVMAPFLKTEAQGADTPLHVALSADWAGVTGQYVKDRKPVPPNARALDRLLVERVVGNTRRLIDATV